MNDKVRVNLSELLPIIEEQLSEEKEVSFSPNGVSMLPMLYPGRDSVTLKKAGKTLKKYDLPLYKRKDGRFVLHRVIKVCRDGTYDMCGDNQIGRERGIKHNQIIGVVTRFVRNGREVSAKNPVYRMYCVFRVKKQQIRLFFAKVKRWLIK